MALFVSGDLLICYEEKKMEVAIGWICCVGMLCLTVVICFLSGVALDILNRMKKW